MPRWPKVGKAVPPILGPWYAEPYVWSRNNIAIANHSGTITQNRIYYWPIEVPAPCTLTKIFWVNGGTINGNVDAGVYTEEGNRIVSTGSTAQSGANVKQEVDITDTVLPSGLLYFAFVTDSATATFWIVDAWDYLWAWLSGTKVQAATFPLPTTATFATASNAGLLKWGALVAPRTVV